MQFQTDTLHFANQNNEKLIYPFGPPVFQTELTDDIVTTLREKAESLNKEDNDFNFGLAGNHKYGRSYQYPRDFIDNLSPHFIEKARTFMEMIKLSSGLEINGDFELDNLWVNISQKHDFNPTHNHDGFISFVVYCDVPQSIFEDQAECNAQIAGKIIFQYGESISKFTKTTYTITPYNGLMLMFPSQLSHFVAPYWVDEKRISAAGNISLIKK